MLRVAYALANARASATLAEVTNSVIQADSIDEMSTREAKISATLRLRMEPSPLKNTAKINFSR